ncbi:DUF4268 domain-containing protein [Acaryochloris sp. CCMEE 5410]|uniref:DUF4268 domain-containing protein n=1 Tax=Acaryochloris sp. CCMEE 5410 TaxID=310037 RepID=UPI0002483D7D|nr:DUF4268 domain-containing protein [Acaryochloris sp. CCMEE 5410]KAI9130816.1 DUF4268 domain-containing protein [Acaryochloris sp. CCMEE 5410]
MSPKHPSKPNLGRLEKVDVTQYWQSATEDFAPWLCHEENMQLLGEAIGLSLEVVLDAQQMCDRQGDLLCRQAGTKNWILIGSQLCPTDEQHFGQLLTEGADISAAGIIWIASQFSAEHLKLLNWLNQHAQPSLQFWGVEIELWQIGKTAMAAQFNLVSPAEESTEDAPDDPTELDLESQLEQQAEALPDPEPEQEEPEPEPLTAEQEQHVAFWSELCDQLEQRGSVVKAVAPPPDDHIDFAIGRAGFLLSAHLNREHTSLAIELRLFDEDAQAHYELLAAQQEQIESELGFALNWENLVSECVIYCPLPETDINATDQWPDYIDWLCGGLECFHLTFADLVQSLNADDYHRGHHHSVADVLSLPS